MRDPGSPAPEQGHWATATGRRSVDRDPFHEERAMSRIRPWAFALLDLPAATLHAGAAPPDDDTYAEARGIVSGLQRIVAPTGVQERTT